MPRASVAGVGKRLRIACYTRPAFLDHSLPLVRALAPLAEVHLFLELSPEERVAGVFGEERIVARPGVRSARGAVDDGYLAQARHFLDGLASFDLVVHGSRRAWAPRTLSVAAAAALRIHGLRPDVLHLEDVTGRSSPSAVSGSGIRKLVAIHDARAHLGERVGRAEMIRRVAVRQADHLLFYSRFSQAQFGASRAPSSVVHSVPNSCGPNHLDRNTRARNTASCSSAACRPTKGWTCSTRRCQPSPNVCPTCGWSSLDGPARIRRASPAVAAADSRARDALRADRCANAPRPV